MCASPCVESTQPRFWFHSFPFKAAFDSANTLNNLSYTRREGRDAKFTRVGVWEHVDKRKMKQPKRQGWVCRLWLPVLCECVCMCVCFQELRYAPVPANPYQMEINQRHTTWLKCGRFVSSTAKDAGCFMSATRRFDSKPAKIKPSSGLEAAFLMFFQ